MAKDLQDNSADEIEGDDSDSIAEVAEEFIKKADKWSPVPDDDKGKSKGIDPTYQNEDGSFKAKPPAKPSDGAGHPLGNALKRAKAEIANILNDEMNLEYLGNALFQKFREDPIKFLKEFGPLLERYEELSMKGESDEGAAVRILVQNSEDGNQSTAVEISDGKDN
jgi:hypothetical protein